VVAEGPELAEVVEQRQAVQDVAARRVEDHGDRRAGLAPAPVAQLLQALLDAVAVHRAVEGVHEGALGGGGQVALAAAQPLELQAGPVGVELELADLGPHPLLAEADRRVAEREDDLEQVVERAGNRCGVLHLDGCASRSHGCLSAGGAPRRAQ
jgi:hypothetical protein